jgi:uncharacterized protein
MKLINLLAAMLAITLSFVSLNTVAADAGKKHHVVFHVTDSDPVKWNQVLNNAGNLQKNIGKENIDIEVVANGPGLDMLKLESQVGERMSEAVKNGIELKACGATMKAAKITEKDLFPGVTTVPGGVIEIMQKQEAGWTYLKI